MDCAIELDIFGGFKLRVAYQNAPTLPKKTRALLAYLAVNREREVARSSLAELLWSDRGRDQVHHSMRQALAELRKSLRREIVISRNGTLALTPEVIVSGEELLRAGEAIEADLDGVAPYKGPLLDGFPPISPDFDDWLQVTRSQIEGAILAGLGAAAETASLAGNAAKAVIAAERMYQIDPLREDTHRVMLRAYAESGRRSDALRLYSCIVETLRRELNVAPARATRELAQQIRLENSSVAAPAPCLSRVEPLVAASCGPTIAVLPFRQIGSDPIAEYRLEGLAADICHQLAGLREFSVISHGSTAGLPTGELDLRATGRMLGARFLVFGSIQGTGGAARIRAELADAETGLMIWSRTEDLGFPLSFLEQDRMVAHIVNTLAPRVHEAELRRIRGKRPAELTTYDRVLLAREHLRLLEPQDVLRAKQLLQDVIMSEPDYAEAYALASNCHSLLISQGLSQDRDTDLRQLETTAQQALALDGDNVRALTQYGHRRSLLHRDYLSAQRMFERALDVNPSAALTWVYRSITATYCGNADEALRYATRALELSPRDREAHIFLSAFCLANYAAGSYASAADWGMKALNERHVLAALYRYVAAALAASGQTADAREVTRRGLVKMPNQTTAEIIARSAFRDETDRNRFGKHLLLAGFPP